jgi:hypothetical protein
VFLFNEGRAFRESIEFEFMGLNQGESQRASFITLFTGPVPTSIEDMPFDINNVLEVFRNSKGTVLSNFQRNAELNELEFTGPSKTNNGINFTEVKQPYLDVARNKWRLFPRLIVNESSYDTIEAGDLNITDSANAYRHIQSNEMLHTADPDLYVSGNTHSQNYATPNRNPFSDPFILEYDQVVTLDHMFFNQTHSGWRFDNTFFDIEYWDPTLLSGVGDWSPSTRISYGGGNTLNEITIPSLTSDKFRIAGGDTGSLGWIQKCFCFFSDQEPVHEPIDITWALLGTQFSGADQLQSGSPYNTRGIKIDNGRAEYSLPWLLVSVGDSNQEGALLLSQASGIVGKTLILPQSLRLSF